MYPGIPSDPCEGISNPAKDPCIFCRTHIKAKPNTAMVNTQTWAEEHFAFQRVLALCKHGQREQEASKDH